MSTDQAAIARDRKAQGIAALGLVSQESDRFLVQSPTLRGAKESHYVWRDSAGTVQCDCPEMIEQMQQDPKFRCEHILAVKHAMLLKNVMEAK